MNAETGRPIAVVLGTRPEIIKLAHIIKLLGPGVVIIHTGQHYDVDLSQAFFDTFRIEPPARLLGIGGASRAHQIGMAITGLHGEFSELRPKAVVVQGDTNTTLAAAIAANADEIPLVHVEAGLRSFDRAMPEEHNRVLTDHLADLCLAPTDISAANLRAERIPSHRIVITGNTVVEAVGELLPSSEKRHEVLEQFGVSSGEFVLSTFHRPENVDKPARFDTIIGQLDSLPLPVVLPLHPRARQMAQDNGLWPPPIGLRVMEPLDYRQFLALLAESALFVGDSGGVQEEVSVLKRPMLVVRRSSERPEVLGTFATLVQDPSEIHDSAATLLDDIERVLAELRDTPTPYGDGTASTRSVEAMGTLVGND